MEEKDDWEDYSEINPNSKLARDKQVKWIPSSLKVKIERGNMNSIFDMPHSTVAETNIAYQLSQRFIADNKGDIYFAKVTLAISKKNYSLHEIIGKIKGYMVNARVTMPRDER